MKNPVLEEIKARRSIRKFQPELPDKPGFLPDAVLLPARVDLFDGAAHHIADGLLVKRLVHVFQNAQGDGLLGVQEAVIGAQHNKDHRGISLLDLPHRIDPVDAWHLDIHERDIRTEALRELDHRAARLCRLDLKLPGVVLFDDIF